VVGTSGTSDGSFHAFFWSPETLIQDVGTIPSNGTTSADAASIGLGISDLGDIGGVSFPAGSLAATPTASPRAFIRPDGGTVEDLNSLIPADSPLYLFSACSINSRGEIIGLAFDAKGNLHGYLATPNDELGDPLDASSLAVQSARFASVWKLAAQRLPSSPGARR
jgi:probable HAF family extracellular repeat protein